MSAYLDIIDTFIDIYSNKPISQITVKEIISQARYNRSTFYDYFYDINHLLESIEEYILDHVQANSELYFYCFVGSDYNTASRLMLQLIDKHSHYLRTLLINNPTFRIRYTKKVKNIYSNKLIYNNTNNNHMIDEAISNALVSLAINMVNNSSRCKENDFVNAERYLFKNAQVDSSYLYILNNNAWNEKLPKFKIKENNLIY